MGRFTRLFAYSAGAVCTGGGLGYAALYFNHKKSMVPKDTVYYYSLTTTPPSDPNTSRTNSQSLQKNNKKTTPYSLPSSPYLPPSREKMIERMKKERFDVLVIGGGATGSGVALDAASRGLNCCLIEQDDFGGGTSSRSTKLIHGGVRYLEKAFEELDFKQLYLVWEALEERAHMLKCAPYMNHPLGILVPIYKLWQVPYFWTGVKTYDTLSKLVCCFDTGVPSSSYLSEGASRFGFPLLPYEGLKGSLLYFDGQMNDSRMNLQIALTSTLDEYIEGMKGAAIGNHLQIIDFLKDESQKLIGVKVRDGETGEVFDVHSKSIVNCTGPFCDALRTKINPTAPAVVEPAGGIHIVLPHLYTSCSPLGLLLPKTTDNRVLFLLPWQGYTLAGTTDAVCNLSYNPVPSKEEVDWVIKELSAYLKIEESRLKGDIQSVWKGIRPLIRHISKPQEASTAHESSTSQKDQVSTSTIVRSHYILVDDESGLISILGGKWTTYRRMAEETIDVLLKTHRDKILPPKTACRTKCLLLQGAVDPTGSLPTKESIPTVGLLQYQLQRDYPELSFTQIRHLVESYGFLARDVCSYIRAFPELSKPLVENDDSLPWMKADVIYGVRHEMARSICDVLSRRTRLAFVNAAKAKECIDQVGEIMSSELGWSAEKLEKKKKEAHAYLESFDYHHQSRTLPGPPLATNHHYSRKDGKATSHDESTVSIEKGEELPLLGGGKKEKKEETKEKKED